jgi:hypothetical protein
MRAWSRGLVWAAAATLLSWARSAGASPADYSRYELGVIERELATRKAEIDPAPEGKRISRIEIVRLEVFDEHDPIPDFFNVFHTTSRERVIRRELLFHTGERWDQHRIDETARNLKALKQLSVVLMVPIAEPDSDQVRVLVITRDVWSLRLNSDFQLGDQGLNYLLVSPAEENVFGTHAKVAAYFALQRDTYSIGGSTSHERILGSRLAGLVSYSAVMNRDSGEQEGYITNFSYGIPFYSVDQRWSFSTGFVVRDYLVREYGPSGNVARFDADATPENDRIPYLYAYERYVSESRATRSFGRSYKLNLSFGLESDRQVYRLQQPEGTDPRAADEFVREELPKSEQRMSPFFQVESYETRFLKTNELETLGLTEDYRLGHSAIVRVYPASRELGSSRDLLGLFSGLSYTLALRDGLLRVLGTSAIESASRGQSDGRASASFRVASPRFGIGRLIVDGLIQNRYRNYLNRKYALGGADRLRGYATDDPRLRGDDAVAMNVEFRTSGVNILSAECGLAAFYDAGGAADSVDAIELRESAGLGLRVMFPEFDRYVMRFDWGFPLSPGYRTFPGSWFVSFRQAFEMPGLSAPSVISDAL